MAHEQLIEYIRHQLTVGHSQEVITASLKEQGWAEQDISEGFTAVKKSGEAHLPPNLLEHSYIETMSPLEPGKTDSNKTAPAQAAKGMWAQVIPKTNLVFMIIFLILIFGVDLIIILTNPGLLGFWVIMLVIWVVSLLFFYLENFVFRKLFAATTSVLDKGIIVLIIARNIIFLLNFIPLVQLLGLLLLGDFYNFFGGGDFLAGGADEGIGIILPAILILYFVLIISRYITTRKHQAR